MLVLCEAGQPGADGRRDLPREGLDLPPLVSGDRPEDEGVLAQIPAEADELVHPPAGRAGEEAGRPARSRTFPSSISPITL